MSEHSYSRCWVHLVWATYERNPLLLGDTAARVSRFLREYALKKQIFMRINFVNSDHVHTLIDLPTNLSLETLAKFLKGSSSFWINKERITPFQFNCQRGYGAFSVSHDRVEAVSHYIANQEEHHRVRTFHEEFEFFLAKSGLVWHDENGTSVKEDGLDYMDVETVETVSEILRAQEPRVETRG